MEDLSAVAVVVVGFLFVLLLRSVGMSIGARLRKRRAHLTQARRHFVKAASLLAQAKSSKVSASEARTFAGRAINEADIGFELDPDDAAILIVKSVALEHLGKTSGAVKVLNTALSKALRKSLSGQERGDTLVKRAGLVIGQAKGRRDSKIQDAMKDLQESITLTPSNAQAHLLLGICHERSGDKDKAMLAFQQALVLNPSYPEANAALERLADPKTFAVTV